MNSHVRIAIPLSKLRVAPAGSHATLHSPANAHPLKVVTGKRSLLIVDFGDAQVIMIAVVTGEMVGSD